MDNPTKQLGDTDGRKWGSVCAVIAQGNAWQFKGWPKGYADETELFARGAAQGFHVRFRDDLRNQTVKNWNIEELTLSKEQSKRHEVNVMMMSFWNTLHAFLASKKPGLLKKAGAHGTIDIHETGFIPQGPHLFSTNRAAAADHWRTTPPVPSAPRRQLQARSASARRPPGGAGRRRRAAARARARREDLEVVERRRPEAGRTEPGGDVVAVAAVGGDALRRVERRVEGEVWLAQ